MHSTLTKLHNN